MGFDSREQANKAIRVGVIIEGKELQARKELPDASRCVNCSVLPRGHDAKNCPNTTKCGRCAGGHATRECTVNDRKKFHCVNCKVTGHGAVDRTSCPSFLRASDIVRSRHPESKYKYFVTEDPMTWISNDVQKRVETARPHKATGKNTGQFNTQGGTAAHSLGSFMVSSHPTRDRKNGGSTKQNKNKMNPNTIPVASSKYRQPSLNQFLARSQRSTSRSSTDRIPWAEDGEIILGTQSDHTRAEQSTSTPPVDL